MNCRRCRTENPDASRYCSACGALLTSSLRKPKRAVPWFAYAGACALVVLVAAYLLLPGLRPSSKKAESVDPASLQPAAPSGSVESIPASADLALAAGRFSLRGLGGAAPASLESALFDGAWTALPLWSFLGFVAPALDDPGPGGLAPAWIDWSPGEPVVFCRFDIPGGPQTPELAPYDGSAVLEWRPLGGERTSFAIEPGPLRTRLRFKSFALYGEIDSPGALVQNGRVVGWTFGNGVARGYLWSPAGGAGPRPILAPAEPVASLRAGSRETAIVQALSMTSDAPADRKLAAFAAGFRRKSLLPDEDLPSFLTPAATVDRMSSLAAAMVREGLAEEVARTLDPSLLAASSDIPLIEAAARAYSEARGFDAAHRLLADLRREPAIRTAPAARRLDEVEVGLAKAALHKILDERGYGGTDIFDGASRISPGDPELRLLGVEVAVLEKNFGRAAELLGARPYPPAFSDKVRTLERLVEEGRRDEDSVTIRFNPGDKLIPVHAVLNGKHRQKFFVDTGATTTIIPTSAVASLEIRIDNSTPVVGFQGVAGGDLAYQVRLDSIEIEGQKVFDVRAIVYDLGESEDAGLLGNDFLQYFQVDLDSVKGILKLRKK